jgi:hypothetical protein
MIFLLFDVSMDILTLFGPTSHGGLRPGGRRIWGTVVGVDCGVKTVSIVDHWRAFSKDQGRPASCVF